MPLQYCQEVNFEGYLDKQGKISIWNWKKYWFVLEGDQLSYYKDKQRLSSQGLIDLAQAKDVRICTAATNKGFPFEIITKERSHVLATETPKLREEWVGWMRHAMKLSWRRSNSINRPSCDSISEDELPDEVVESLRNLGKQRDHAQNMARKFEKKPNKKPVPVARSQSSSKDKTTENKPVPAPRKSERRFSENDPDTLDFPEQTEQQSLEELTTSFDAENRHTSTDSSKIGNKSPVELRESNDNTLSPFSPSVFKQESLAQKESQEREKSNTILTLNNSREYLSSTSVDEDDDVFPASSTEVSPKYQVVHGIKVGETDVDQIKDLWSNPSPEKMKKSTDNAKDNYRIIEDDFNFINNNNKTGIDGKMDKNYNVKKVPESKRTLEKTKSVNTDELLSRPVVMRRPKFGMRRSHDVNTTASKNAYIRQGSYGADMLYDTAASIQEDISFERKFSQHSSMNDTKKESDDAKTTKRTESNLFKKQDAERKKSGESPYAKRAGVQMRLKVETAGLRRYKSGPPAARLTKDSPEWVESVRSDQRNTVESVRSDQRNIVESVQSDQRNTVESVQSDQRNTVESVQSDQRNTVKSVQSDQRNTVESVQSDQRNTVESVQSDQRNTVNNIPKSQPPPLPTKPRSKSASSPTAQTPSKAEIPSSPDGHSVIMRNKDDGHMTREDSQQLSKVLDINFDFPVIPPLPNPRLELTFRSAFDDIRLFIATDRKGDEVYAVPRLSERGGKAILKLKEYLLRFQSF